MMRTAFRATAGKGGRAISARGSSADSTRPLAFTGNLPVAYQSFIGMVGIELEEEMRQEVPLGVWDAWPNTLVRPQGPAGIYLQKAKGLSRGLQQGVAERSTLGLRT